MDTWLELASGPIFQFALLFMILGLLRRVALATIATVRAIRKANDKNIPYKTIMKVTISWLMPVNKIKNNPMFSVTSILMHIGLIVTPIFLFSHMALWERSVGLSLPALSMGPSDVLTLLTIATLFALLAMRIISKESRGLSKFEDYFLLILLAVPFISGYLALHPMLNPFAYKSVMLTHILSADLILILMPLSKLSHAVLMPGTQLFREVAWRFPADSGTNVAIALNKEEEPI